MKLLLLVGLLSSLLFIFSTQSVFADNIATQSAQQSYSTTNEAGATVATLKNFIASLDGLLGGFIFYTPDVFADNITLRDGSSIKGLSNFRNIFYAISIPLIAIATAFFAIQKLGDDRPFVFKSFILRLFMVAGMFIVTPTLLSYTIQANNLLVKQIQQDTKVTTFIDSYLDNVNQQVNSGQDPQKFGIPNTQISIIGGFINSFWKFLLQGVLFFITLIFLITGLLFIAFQSVIRFATLLFLSVLFPLAIPFALSEKTEGITNEYFKTWLSFLIHQPAFVLGYAIAAAILEQILAKNGASIGLLFFYTGFLFFLGSANVLVSRIFSESWAALSANLGGAVLSGAVNGAVFGTGKKTVGLFKQGMVGGSVNGFRSLAGRSFARKAGILTMDGNNFGFGKAKAAAEPKNSQSQAPAGSPGGGAGVKSATDTNTPRGTKTEPKGFSYSRELQNKGMKTEVVDQKQGIVSVSGEGYKYNDQAAGITTIYPTRTDGISDGLKGSDLEKVNLSESKYIDLSNFNEKNPNPHNAAATREAKRLGYPSNHAHVTAASSPDRVKNFLTISEKDHQKSGIDGVIVKRYGNSGGVQSKDRVIRLYTKKS